MILTYNDLSNEKQLELYKYYFDEVMEEVNREIEMKMEYDNVTRKNAVNWFLNGDNIEIYVDLDNYIFKIADKKTRSWWVEVSL